MYTSLAGQTVIVTGATKGIGRGIAGRFAAAGAIVMVVSRNAAEAEATAAALGGGAFGFAADVSDADQADAMAAACEMVVAVNGTYTLPSAVMMSGSATA